MPEITFSNGLASGLDSQAIIDALISAQRRPAALLEGRIAERTNQIGAFKGLSTILLSLKIETDRLKKPDTFGGFVVTTSDEDAVTATAGSRAAPGSFTFTVDALAQAEVLVSQGFASTGAATGTGTLSISLGSASATEVTIDPAHATLAGLRDAINAADAGVTASIVNTGTGATPYRLMLTGKESGEENSIAFTASLTGGTAPAFGKTLSTPTRSAGFAGTATFTNLGPATPGAFAGTATPAAGGSYTGAANRTFTFTAESGGTIGTDAMTLAWSDGAGRTGTVALAAGYTPGAATAVVDGITVSLGAGTLVSGDQFTVAATGRGSYTGAASKSYEFTVTSGGTVGTDAITIGWDDGAGATGTITVPSTYALRSGIAVAEGIVLAVDGGTLATGDRFTIDAGSSVLQTAQNAKITFGSTSGGGTPLSVESATNVFEDALDGLTLTVRKAGPDPVTLEVARDVEGVTTNVKNFVSRYNSVLDFMKTQLTYDSETGKSGVLFSDPTLLSLDLSLRRMVVSRVPGVTGAFRALSSIGITTGAGGKLSIDEEKLALAIAEDPDSVRQLFAATGRTTDADVSFLALGDRTRATSGRTDGSFDTDGYAVRITRAAERPLIAGANIDDPATTPLVIGTSNNVVQIRVNGALSSQIVLTEGSYATGDEAAAMLQSKINADAALSASPVTVTYVDAGGGRGRFEIGSDQYGEDGSIELIATAGDAFVGAFGFASGQIGTVARGVDVAGTINGEEAHGSGQTLVGGPKSPEDPEAFDTLGVRILVTLTAEELDAQGADQGSLHVTDGLGALLSRQLDRLTGVAGGILQSRQNSLDRQIDGLNEQIDRIDARLAVRRRSLELLFSRLEQSILEMQSQGTFLGSQLSGLSSG